MSEAQNGRPETWRIVLDRRALPLPLLRPLTIGSDPRNGLQIPHRSVRAFHARIEKRGPTLLVEEVEGTGGLAVDGAPRATATLRGGETLQVGDVKLKIERGTLLPAVAPSAAAPPSLEQEFLALFVRELKRAPWFVVSCGLHAALFYLLAQFAEPPREEGPPAVLRAAVDRPREPLPLQTPEPPAVEEAVEVPDEPIELPPLALAEPGLPDHVDPAPDDLPLMVGVGSFGELGNGDGGAVRSGFGGTGIQLRALSGPLREHVRELREHGLDVVFLVDTTASMDPFLAAAKQTIDTMITDLAALVPNLRLGIIAYRDEGEAYVTRAAPLSTDRYAIMNFVEALQAAGGGDTPEAVLAAIEEGLDRFEWRPNAHRVLLVVADAPPHERDLPRIRMRLQAAARAQRTPTVVSAILTGPGVALDAEQSSAAKALREIAAAGGGEFAHLENYGQVVAQLIAMTLGSQHRAAAEAALAERRHLGHHHLLEERVQERDLDWLFGRLHRERIDPLVVKGLVEIGSPGVANRSLTIVNDETLPRPTREAALYVLRKVTGYDGALDVARPIAMQEDEIRRIRRSMERLLSSRP